MQKGIQKSGSNLSELVEYYFEICGSYALGTSDETQYRKRPALTSVEELRAFFSEEMCIRDRVTPRASNAARVASACSRPRAVSGESCPPCKLSLIHI